ncbi:hypothetical protein GGX14DRAFT_610794 [Mycena pura]|uniref:Uncharacterized protein n=1 Tax=Mycena pura TaxID=153505 RepID=A0AAD6VMY0_9AGAR|nr:hypothetical protein GGX14DRAFT_610794 [Mycena pura]
MPIRLSGWLPAELDPGWTHSLPTLESSWGPTGLQLMSTPVPHADPSPQPEDIYLFLFPPQAVFKDGLWSVEIPSPNDAYYWSFDQNAQDRVSTEVLEAILPPTIFLETNLAGYSWAEDDVKLLQQYCLLRGLDPHGTDLATQLEYPLAMRHDDPPYLSPSVDEDLPNLETLPPPSQWCSPWWGFEH